MSKDTLQDSGVELNCFKKKLFSHINDLSVVQAVEIFKIGNKELGVEYHKCLCLYNFVRVLDGFIDSGLIPRWAYQNKQHSSAQGVH